MDNNNQMAASTESSGLQQSNPITRKLNKILESRIENDKDLIESLKTLSGYFTQNNIRTRRNLRSDIEKRSLILNEEFLNAFKEVKEKLDFVCNDISSMSESCENITSRLKQVKLQTNELITKTTSLQAEKVHGERRLNLVKSFIDKFQLSNDEIVALSGNKENFLHKDFFKALDKVQKIHNDCKVLLRTNQQTLGLEIMEQMSLNQEAAFERLYRWSQNESRLLCNDAPEISEQFSEAMSVLKLRPILFKYTLDEYCTSRRNAVVKLFIDALTKGQGNSKPIELNSHDPLRYIGDMLAWIHQATASEHEYLRSLLRKLSNDEIETQLKINLGFIMEGVCRSLKIRIEQILVSQQGSILFKISNVLKFYHYTIGLRITENSALIQTLDELNSLSYKMFLNSLNIHATRLLDKIEAPNLELMPSVEFQKTLGLVKEIFDSYNTSVVSLSSKKGDYDQILDVVLEPMLQMCSLSAVNLSQIEMAVYMVNCVYTIQSMLSLYEYTDIKLEKLEAQVEALMDTLINEQAYFILTKTDLLDIYKGIQNYDFKIQGPLINKLGMDTVSLRSAMTKFDAFLSKPDSLTIPQYNLIYGASLRSQLSSKSMKLVTDAYASIYKIISDPGNGYTNINSVAPRTPDQVAKLLS